MKPPATPRTWRAGRSRSTGANQAPQRSGQVIVEFSAAFIIFIVVFFALIEFSRALNVLVSLNSVASSAALFGAAEDPTMSLKASSVESYAIDLAGRFGSLDPGRMTVSANVNYQPVTGAYYTRVSCTYNMGTLLIPVGLLGGGTMNDLPLTVTVAKANEIQMLRP